MLVYLQAFPTIILSKFETKNENTLYFKHFITANLSFANLIYKNANKY